MTQAKDLLSPFNPYMERCLDEYKYPKTTRAAIAGLRHYTVNGEERPLPSVTTILSKTKPKADQESIERWKARVGEKEANKIKNEDCSAWNYHAWSYRGLAAFQVAFGYDRHGSRSASHG